MPDEETIEVMQFQARSEVDAIAFAKALLAMLEIITEDEEDA